VTTTEVQAAHPDRVWRWLVVGAAFVGGVAVWALTGFSPLMAGLILFATLGAAAVALLVPTRPAAAVGIVFLLAVFERLEVATVVGSMRFEQPAIVALVAAAVWHRDRLDLPSLRPIWPLLAAAAVYLGSLALSSLIVAEQPAVSMRVVLWSAVSMAGGLAAAWLLAGRVRGALPWLAGTGALVAALGIAAALSYVAFGNWSPVVAGAAGSPRVFLPAYEPNLYASLLALVVPIALEQFRHRPRARNLLVLALPLLALGLGITRAAYIGLAVGLVLFFIMHLRLAGLTPVLRRAAVVTAICTLVGLALPAFVLNPQYSGLLKAATVAVVNPGAPVEPTPTPLPGTEAKGELDTLEYRMERVWLGLEEWRASPIIGRGAYSYGQRHIDNNDVPEVIAVLPVLVLHDAGIVGSVGLAAFLVLLAWMLWRVSSDRLRGPPAIALGAAVVVMLVGYLSTTALHFAVTWLVIGAAVAAGWPYRATGQETAMAPSESD